MSKKDFESLAWVKGWVDILRVLYNTVFDEMCYKVFLNEAYSIGLSKINLKMKMKIKLLIYKRPVKNIN